MTNYLQGRKFGKLTALEVAGARNGNGNLYWWCRCDCGSVRTYRSDSLLQGRVKSCGQCSMERTAKRMITYNGETHNVTRWAEIVGLGRVTLMMRLRNGWSVERALTEPVGHVGRRTKRKWGRDTP